MTDLFIFPGQYHLFVQAKTCFLTGKHAVIPSNGYFKLHWGNSGIIEKLLVCLWERGSADLACSEIKWVIYNKKLKWPTELMNWFCCHREEFIFLLGKVGVFFFYKFLLTRSCTANLFTFVWFSLQIWLFLEGICSATLLSETSKCGAGSRLQQPSCSGGYCTLQGVFLLIFLHSFHRIQTSFISLDFKSYRLKKKPTNI